jgi:hypothetical protein
MIKFISSGKADNYCDKLRPFVTEKQYTLPVLLSVVRL